MPNEENLRPIQKIKLSQEDLEDLKKIGQKGYPDFDFIILDRFINNFINWVKNQKFNKMVLLSINYKDLIELYLVDNGIGNNYSIQIFKKIIQKCTDMSADDYYKLWYTHKDVKELVDCINYISEFNFKMAQFFNKNIV